ncbi:MAG: hypothetical protein JXR46_12450 [Calditrichaceae bacterium]|nr:hypothetical protein [Calditrichaceae bacterium]MBN2709848.1 hypothetical protein [Calditrichaceae bacterium]RQV95831.1 MAG: hypothetical protein EH224_06335 [Calditrichota bacterium]
MNFDFNRQTMGSSIDHTLPAGISAEFDIELTYTKHSHGDYKISSDFPLKIEEDEDWEYDHGEPRKVIRGAGKTGDGKNRVHIETINGDIRIHKK